MLPDYVLARGNKSKWEISFLESKGRTKDYPNKIDLVDAWIEQSKNANFFHKGKIIPATQNLLITTRINSRSNTWLDRSIRVRAWNAYDPNAAAKQDNLHPLWVIHYYGVCQRIGWESNAELIAANSLLNEHINRLPQIEDDPRNVFIKEREHLRAEQKRLKSTIESLTSKADDEINADKIDSNYLGDNNHFIGFYHNPRRSTYNIGDRQIRIGLTDVAMNMVKWLQGRILDFDFDEFEYLDKVFYEDSEPDDAQFSIRSDGVILQRIN
jgi:hypothetical protein